MAFSPDEIVAELRPDRLMGTISGAIKDLPSQLRHVAIPDWIVDVDALRAQINGEYPKTAFVTIASGRRVSISDSGEPYPGAPVLLCYAGWTVDGSLNYAGLHHEMAPHARIITIDNPGTGGTQAETTNIIAESAFNGTAVMRALGIDRYTVLGYSMGGAIATLHALLRPGEVEAMMLGSTSDSFDLGFDVLKPFPLLAAALAKLPREMFKSPMLPDLEGLPFGGALAELSRDDLVALVDAGANLENWHSADVLPHLDMPVAVIATLFDGLVWYPHQRRMFDLLPNATFHTVAASHLGAPLGFGAWPRKTTQAFLALQRGLERDRAGNAPEIGRPIPTGPIIAG